MQQHAFDVAGAVFGVAVLVEGPFEEAVLQHAQQAGVFDVAVGRGGTGDAAVEGALAVGVQAGHQLRWQALAGVGGREVSAGFGQQFVDEALG